MSAADQGSGVRVFISYSTKGADLVQRLKDGLARAGVDVWLDHERLTIGTPNWQRAIRDGIAQASHVIYVASETAAESPYVYDEISLARGKGKQVIPFWARGTEWHECIPLGWGLSQYADGRGASFDAGLAKLLKSLSAGASSSIPPTLATASRYPLPDVPVRLASLGFRGVNVTGTPAIIPPLITIPAGPFLMGSDKWRDPQAQDNELLQHRVELAIFRIAKYPVTVAEYALAVKAKAVPEPMGNLFSIRWGEQQHRSDHPVVCVSWQDAMAYIAWLADTTGQRGWRMPSEAEWEKAARWDAQAQHSRIYPWGDSFDHDRCNTIESGIGTTSPVGSYPATDEWRSGASPYGVEDIAGNVWEWTSSLLNVYPYTQNDGREDQKSTINRALRGGTWGSSSSNVRAAYRVNWWNIQDYSVGFRLTQSEAGTS